MATPTSSGCVTSVSVFLVVVVVVVDRPSLFFDAPSSGGAADACYVYPTDVPDPCKGKTCSYGARCVASLDGHVARCQCPETCSSYGDSVGSTPVCGTDGVDYPNECELQKASCREMKDIGKKYDGKCGKWRKTNMFLRLNFDIIYGSSVASMTVKRLSILKA